MIVRDPVPSELLFGLFGLSGSQLLGLSVFAALVGTLGNLLATWLRDFVSIRSFERWKERRTLEAVYWRYRKQLHGAAEDLQSRTKEICHDPPPAWLRGLVLADKPARLERNRSDDPYFQRYRLISTIYQLCALLGWIELYRQELTFLDPRREKTNERLDELFREIRHDLAHGTLNRAPDFAQWRDHMIFKEEQRAIGEYMLSSDAPRKVIGYGAFLRLFENAKSVDERWWIDSSTGLFVDLHGNTDKDFRLTRLKRLDGHLVETIELLNRGLRNG